MQSSPTHYNHYTVSVIPWDKTLPPGPRRDITLAMAVRQTHSNCRHSALTLAHCRRVHSVRHTASPRKSTLALQPAFVRPADGFGVFGILQARGGRLCTLMWPLAQLYYSYEAIVRDKLQNPALCHADLCCRTAYEAVAQTHVNRWLPCVR